MKNTKTGDFITRRIQELLLERKLQGLYDVPFLFLKDMQSNRQEKISRKTRSTHWPVCELGRAKDSGCGCRGRVTSVSPRKFAYLASNWILYTRGNYTLIRN